MKSYLEEKAPSGTRAIATPARSDNSSALYNSAYVDQLLRSAAGFAVRRRTQGPAKPPTPSAIVLLYVEAPDEENLLSAFDFSAYSHPLRDLSDYDDEGHQKRHDMASAFKAVDAFLLPDGPYQHRVAGIRSRIQQVRDRESFLLPPRNFHVSKGQAIAGIFKDIRSGKIAWEDAVEGLNLGEFTIEDFSVIKPRQTRRAFVDNRDIVFLCADRSAYHGLARELSEEDEIEAVQRLLQSLFRFGAPLPDGFHHDAQPKTGKFTEQAFDCPIAGEQPQSGGYANIYPDDFVRMGDK